MSIDHLKGKNKFCDILCPFLPRKIRQKFSEISTFAHFGLKFVKKRPIFKLFLAHTEVYP